MITVYNKTELADIPLVEREVSTLNNDGVLAVEFNLIDDVNIEVIFKKKYPARADAERSAVNFLLENDERVNANFDWEKFRSFEEQQALSKIMLFEKIINNELPLPDNSVGFSCNLNLNYLKNLVETLRIKHNLQHF